MRISNLFFGLAGLFGLSISIITTISSYFSDERVSDVTIMAILATDNILLIGLSVLLLVASKESGDLRYKSELENKDLRYKQKNLNRKILSDRNKASITYELLHNIQHEVRDRNNELKYILQNVNSGNAEDNKTLCEEVKRINGRFHLFLVDNIKAIFDTQTGHNCAVCIKMLDASDDENPDAVMVQTYVRDTISYRARKINDSSIFRYPYYENTAFKRILSPRYPNSCYASEDLQNETGYLNLNQNWGTHYNSTLVCPIRMQLIDPSDLVNNAEHEELLLKYSVLGFICVDNKEGGLDKSDLIQILAGICDNVYHHLELYSEVVTSLELEIENSERAKDMVKYFMSIGDEGESEAS